VDAEGAVTVTSLAPKTAVVAPATPRVATTATLAAARTTKVDICANYDAVTAALGSRTIDCLGTIGPDSYFIDDKGRLRPRFKACQQIGNTSPKVVFEDITAALSLQDFDPVKGENDLDADGVTDAISCIAGRWAAWRKQFLATEIKNCPIYKRVEILSPPTEEGIKELVTRNPPLTPDKPLPAGTTAVTPHENYLVDLQFPGGAREPRCKDEADCAQKCLGGFKGTFIEGSGTKALLDPTYWWITIQFPGTNPFMAPGYYHPMSFYGTVPGALYGHRNRKGEACSRFVLGEHMLLTLDLDCIDPAVASTCVTVCREPEVDTAGTESEQRF
jgi:hypothetical protein